MLVGNSKTEVLIFVPHNPNFLFISTLIRYVFVPYQKARSAGAENVFYFPSRLTCK